MNRQSSEITTIEVTTGTKYTVLKKFVPRTLTFTRSARIRASPAWTGTTTTAKYAVFRSDAQKTLSPNSVTKLSRPTGRAGRGDISRAFVNASPKASSTGTRKKTTSRMTAGDAIAAPTKVSRECAVRTRTCRWVATSGVVVTAVMSELVVAVGLDVVVDVGGRLVENLLRISAGEDVGRRLLERRGDERVRRRDRPDLGVLLRELEEDPVLPAGSEVGNLGGGVGVGRDEPEGLGVGDVVLRLRRELQVLQRAVLGGAGRRHAPLPGRATDLRTVAEVRRRQEDDVSAVLLGHRVGGPAAVPHDRALAVDEVQGRVLARRLLRVALLDQVLEPGRPLQGVRSVQYAGGGLVAVPVDQVAAEALQQGRVGVRDPLTGSRNTHVQGVGVLAAGLDLGDRRVELGTGPRFVDRRDPDAVLREHGLAGGQVHRDVVVAERVDLVVDLAESARQLLVEEAGRQVQRLQITRPGPVRHVRAVDVHDARQLLRRGRRRHRVVVGRLGEGLQLHFVLGLAGVEGIHDLLVDREFGGVAAVVRPEFERRDATLAARTAVGRAGRTGRQADGRGEDERDRPDGPLGSVLHGPSPSFWHAEATFLGRLKRGKGLPGAVKLCESVCWLSAVGAVHGVADHQRTVEDGMLFAVMSFYLCDQGLYCPCTHLVVRQRDRGQAGPKSVGDELLVVEADHRQVLGYAQTELGRRVVRAHGHPVVEAEQGRRPVRC